MSGDVALEMTSGSGDRLAAVRRCASLLALVVAFASLTLAPAAFGASTHPFSHSFSVGTECGANGNEGDIAVHEATNTILVLCTKSPQESEIRQYDFNGNPVNFTANEPYISGNTLTYNPDPAAGTSLGGDGVWGSPGTIAVDNSNTANNGFIYFASDFSAERVEAFKPSGQWIGSLPERESFGTPMGVGVDRQGYVYVGAINSLLGPHISKFDPAFNEVGRLYFDKGISYVRADSTGAVFAGNGWTFGRRDFQGTNIYKFEADQFNPDLAPDIASLGTSQAPTAQLSPYINPAGLLPTAFPESNPPWSSFDIDPNTGDLYVLRESFFTTFTPGNAQDPAHNSGPDITGLTNAWGIAADSDGKLFVLDNGGATVNVYNPGERLPDVVTHPAAIDDLGHNDATVRATIDPAGGDPVTSCEVEYGTGTSYGNTASCSPDPAGSNFTGPTEVSADLSGLTLGQRYHYRFKASNGHGDGFGADRDFTTVAVLHVHTNPVTDIDTESATFHGSLDPDGISTDYWFQYGLGTDYRNRTDIQTIPSGGGDIPLTVPVDGLQAGRTYHVRLVARNNLGVTFGPDVTFKTPAAPQIGGLRATDLTATSATLNARIDGQNEDTTYHFEYGSSISYGTNTPVPDGSLAASTDPQDVSIPVSGLTPGIVYHFRIVATNKWGTSVSDDTTFNFSPQSCPNQHVRQQTGANYLPDCRAYELVSPANAAPAVLFPSHITLEFGAGFGLGDSYEFAQWIQNTGEATNPSRFLFYAGLGAIPGLDPPNAVLDAYLSTRTEQGWVTTFPGLTGVDAGPTARRMCSVTLDECLDHKAPALLGTSVDENAPYLFDASGKYLGQVPTNVNTIPGGKKFSGDQQASGDMSHFAFSSKDIAFAPGGQTTGIGSAYDNDIKNRTVQIISKLPNGDDIQRQGPNPLEFITFPPNGISEDGSHILMKTAAPDGPNHLYMRVNDSVTYDIARGAGVKFLGMTSNGKTVVFSAGQRLLPADTDTSSDIYRWDEDGDKLTLLTQGNGQGNADDCSTSYSSLCDAVPLTTDRGPHGGYEFGTYDPLYQVPGIDSTIARDSGDVYFYSPESLDSQRLGVRNEKNLYVYHEGEPRLVATLEPGTSIHRIQISPNGDHAAFITNARLTGYDNKGFETMYTYNADTRVLRCASCNPSGQPPAHDVAGSEGGPFMSDDGRAFFATKDALVPQDTDGLTSVYEFAEGRPQLISSGTSERDFAGSGLLQAFFVQQPIGLESVSHDGVDVIFSTYDSLVPQDQNGPWIKFYDARTGGGFPPAPPLAPCVAADECHGEDSSAPTVPQVPTTANLGQGSNIRPAKRPKCKKGKVRRKGKCVKRSRGKRRHGRRHHHRSARHRHRNARYRHSWRAHGKSHHNRDRQKQNARKNRG